MPLSLEIEDHHSFIEVIERMTTMGIDDRIQQREIVKKNLYKWLSDSKALDDNRSLYITNKLT